MKKKLFPDDEVIRAEHFNVSQDWETPIPAFFIIASNRKARSVGDFNEEEAQEFIRLVVKIRKGMKEVLGINDVYMIQNEDTDTWFHLWMFPRFDWMEKFGRKIESVRPIMNYAEKNMVNDEVINEVKDSVKKMKEYMKDF